MWELQNYIAWLESWSPWHLRAQVAAYQRHLNAMQDIVDDQQVMLKSARARLEQWDRKERARVQSEMDELVKMIRGPEDSKKRLELFEELRQPLDEDEMIGDLIDYAGS
jgi:hypothetical protein